MSAPTDRGASGTAVPDRASEPFVSERPWGRFQQFVSNEPVTVKVITVQPGHRLSLQRHHDRDEMWQLLDGTLEVQIGEQTWTVARDDRVWAPRGELHRMSNTGAVEARVLEIAFGAFDESDIERLDDDYARTEH